MKPASTRKFFPACAPTGVGSLPFENFRGACEFVNEFYHEILFTPQLPQNFFKKNLITEFFEKIPLTQTQNGFPKFILEGNDPKLLPALRDFRFNDPEENEILNFFQKRGEYFKTQITGPVTMLLNISDAQDRNLFEFPKLVEWMKDYLIERARSRARMISARGWTPIVFLDEPSLFQLEPLLLTSQKKFLTELLNFFVEELSKEGAIVGLHCCGNTDWSLVFDSGFDIVSFDAVKDMNHFLAEKERVRAHFKRGGVVAWGIVPSEYLGYELDCGKLVESFLAGLAAITTPELSLNQVLLQSMVTTSCGTAGLSLSDNESAHRWVQDVSGILKGFIE